MSGCGICVQNYGPQRPEQRASRCCRKAHLSSRNQNISHSHRRILQCLLTPASRRRTLPRTSANGSSATRGVPLGYFRYSGCSIRVPSTRRRYPAPLPRAPLRNPRSDCYWSHSFCVCLLTCSSRHLTSRLIHAFRAFDLSLSSYYISITHSLRSRGLLFSFWCVLGQSRLRAWGSNTTRELLEFLAAIRVD